MDISVSNDSDDEILNKLLFYENWPSVKNKSESLSLSESESCSTKFLKVEKGNSKSYEIIGKISQNEMNKKKLLKFKKKNKKEKSSEKKLENISKNIKPNTEEDTNFKELKSEKVVPSETSSNYLDLLNEESDNHYDKCYLCCKPEESGSLLVALFPNTKIYLIGNYKLKLILGNISVLGYKFKEKEEHIVFSPSTHSSLAINVHEGYQVKRLGKERIRELNLSYDWVQDFNISKDDCIVIVLLSRFDNNTTKILCDADNQKKEDVFNVCIWREALGVRLIEDFHNFNLRLQNEPEEWDQYMNDLHSYFSFNKKNIFVICGGKSVGKSTFLKYTINKFLSNFSFTSVVCIDLDPGQSEFSLPSCLTLSVCSTPLLGPSFSHHENIKYSYQKQIMLGDISIQNVFEVYLDIAWYLVQEYKRHYSYLPLVVNTMGFTASMGFDIMIDILRMIEPSHVISIESPDSQNNYHTQLTCDIVSNINRGILTNNYKRLYYNYNVFKTVAKVNKSISSKFLREVNIMGYLSKLWKCNETQFTLETINEPAKINWSTVAIHLFGLPIEKHAFLAINSSLVALCRVCEEFLYRQDRSQPLLLHQGSPWRTSCVCLGWGIVKGTDPIAKDILIYTPLNKERIEEINFIFMPNVKLPMKMRNLFS